MYPEELRYSKDHEWIRVDGELGRIGVTDYAQTQLGDVVFLELPEVGQTVAAGDQFGTVESVKAVSELFSPVAGEVVEVNADLTSKPELVNEDPHGEAWMIVVKLSDPAALESLMDAKAYGAFVESESK
jgi:glycine cleavage system H protein